MPENGNARLLDILELLGLMEQRATIREVGLDAIILDVEVSGGETLTVAVAPCQQHPEGETHLNFFLIEDGADSTST